MDATARTNATGVAPRRFGPVAATIPTVNPAAPTGLLVGAFRRFGLLDWMRVVVVALVFALLIAVPTRLVPNAWFQRMTPTRPQDYLFLVVASLLAGLVAAMRHVAGREQQGAVVAGGLGTFLAVGCPVCNKVVVALVGMAGATQIFAPLQPAIAAGSIALLLWAVYRTSQAMAADACPIPSGRDEH